MAELTLIFDGRCGVCTRAAGWLRQLDRGGRIQLRASQEHGVRQAYGLTQAQTDVEIWGFRVVTGEGRVMVSRGAGAAAVALDVAMGTRIFRNLYRFPPLRWCADRVYAWVSAHRGRFPGTTPWCTQNPGACEDTQVSRANPGACGATQPYGAAWP